MKKIHILGAKSLVGSHFVDKNKTKFDFICYSRNDPNMDFLNIKDISSLSLLKFKNSYLISFIPVWLSCEFLTKLENNDPEIFRSLKGIIVYSSTSLITKRFSSNNKDKKLVNDIKISENNILSLCKNYSINCTIIRPTIIYGQYKDICDKNLSVILKIFKKIPFCFVPRETGYRQPIHFSELSNLTNYFLNELVKKPDKNKYLIAEVGGDEEIKYREMLFRLNSSIQKNSKKCCKIIPIPNNLFYFLICPFLIIKPNIFEALFRIQSNFSGFPSCSSYTGKKFSKFPLKKYNL